MANTINFKSITVSGINKAEALQTVADNETGAETVNKYTFTGCKFKNAP